jgi:FtsH-binding integral membrane protein
VCLGGISEVSAHGLTIIVNTIANTVPTERESASMEQPTRQSGAPPMNHTTTLTNLPTPTWQRTALRWMPTFLGFPAGGLATTLIVGHVDNITAAVTGGALSGAILGLVQPVALRVNGSTRRDWVVASAVGFSIGLTAGASLVGYATKTGALATQGVITGLTIGLAQAIVLHRRGLIRLSAVWPVVLAGLWALGWTITATAGIDVEKQYSVFGSSGAIVVTAATAVLPLALARANRQASAR